MGEIVGLFVGKGAGVQLGRMHFIGFAIFPSLSVILEESRKWAKNFINCLLCARHCRGALLTFLHLPRLTAL